MTRRQQAVDWFLELESAAGYPHLVPVRFRRIQTIDREVGWPGRRTETEYRAGSFDHTGWLISSVSRTHDERAWGGGGRYEDDWFLLSDGDRLPHVFAAPKNGVHTVDERLREAPVDELDRLTSGVTALIEKLNTRPARRSDRLPE